MFARSKRVFAAFFPLATACLVLPRAARADESGYAEQVSSSGQAVVFKDDPLAAGGFGPNDVRLQVRPSAARMTLLRPRTQFVSALIKTVEQL